MSSKSMKSQYFCIQKLISNLYKDSLYHVTNDLLLLFLMMSKDLLNMILNQLNNSYSENHNDIMLINYYYDL